MMAASLFVFRSTFEDSQIWRDQSFLKPPQHRNAVEAVLFSIPNLSNFVKALVA